MIESKQDLQIQVLLGDYAAARRQPRATLQRLHAEAEALAERNIWITLLSWDAISAQLEAVEVRRAAGAPLPLYGVPFAVKDNIDLADVPTTAACPSYERRPTHSAPVVERLLQAGAIVLGKTNLDQFATGLVGSRSPYGACGSALDPSYISGGSSSGSALAVALGLVSFALGTDTAGSGRVPAALNNIVGLKPTRGLLSTRGVVPACRSLDCVSVFAGNVSDCLTVFDLASGYDAGDPFSRQAPPGASEIPVAGFRFGVPEPLELFGDTAAAREFASAVQRLQRLGGTAVRVDFAPFQAAAELLYAGAFVAERSAAAGDFLAQKREGEDPIVAAIIRGAGRFSAVDAFEAQYRLRALRREVQDVWRDMDVLVVPTTPTTYTLEQIARDPIALNSRLGTYTNFTNLLDLCGIAVPTGFKADNLPFGVTLLGPAFADRAVARLGDRLLRSQPASVGATGNAVRGLDAPGLLGSARAGGPGATPDPRSPVPRVRQSIRLAVVGAHLTGQPLHHQLVDLGARLESSGRSAPHYRLYALTGSVPPKPGLLRTSAGGAAIELEVYALDAAAFGQFVAAIAAPLGIGNVQLEDGTWVKGFLCESVATETAADITHLGGWLAYLATRR
jgi:allophanate hydrolase